MLPFLFSRHTGGGFVRFRGKRSDIRLAASDMKTVGFRDMDGSAAVIFAARVDGESGGRTQFAPTAE